MMEKETYLGLFEIAKRLNITKNQAKWFARRYINEIRFQKRNIKDKLYNFEDFKKVVEKRKKHWELKTESLLNKNKKNGL
jgi:hypothetical protein